MNVPCRCFVLMLWLAAAWGAPFGDVWAQAQASSGSDAEDVCKKTSEAVISAQSQWGRNAAKVAEDIVSPSRNVFNTDCLSKLTYGIRYSISSIFQGFDLKKMVCRALQSVVKRYSSSLQYSASLPYGILGINVGGNVGVEGGGGGGGFDVNDLFRSGVLISNYDQNRIDTGSLLKSVYQAYDSGAVSLPSAPSTPVSGAQSNQGSGGSGSTPYHAGGGR